MKQLIKPILILSALFFFSCEGEKTKKQNNQPEESHKSEVTSKDINAQEFKTLIEKGAGIIVDVRTPGEFTRGYIEGAKNINISGNFSEEIQKLDKNQPVYVYCASGGRSSRAMQMMKQMGFKEVYNLMGGYNAWPK